ncbi:VPLPA-CTERM sorting domain-containing protein [Roseobacter denitrificans]|nr:VPLPA-CTERM sorting domain-containing protein [Roseobacter denitrificans]SFF77452.1 VPLPA-CTERM protein sorting domain-containing protein [Roseobacter denitrificans OCh 114]
MSVLKSIAVAAVMTGAAGMTQAATVDFNNFAEGAVLGDNTDLGGGVFADITAFKGIDKAVVFNTLGAVNTTKDKDLLSPFTNAEDATDKRGFGNALIVQENDGAPDDNGSGGTIVFSFLTDVILDELFLLDSEIGTTASLFSGSTLVKAFSLTADNESDTGNNPANNEFTVLDFGGATGDKLEVVFTRSGAVGEIEVSAVPVPAGLPLLLGGIGAFAWIKRRKKA